MESEREKPSMNASAYSRTDAWAVASRRESNVPAAGGSAEVLWSPAGGSATYKSGETAAGCARTSPKDGARRDGESSGGGVLALKARAADATRECGAQAARVSPRSPYHCRAISPRPKRQACTRRTPHRGHSRGSARMILLVHFSLFFSPTRHIPCGQFRVPRHGTFVSERNNRARGH
jgi:hypothetical protein